ncbi:MAG TPA: TetR/AcrR family transcriptional regulator [Saprospiraceae bacterium]|nr:TetR/AcrR family transcriptional regulator [Saprospiraceae bacterium]
MPPNTMSITEDKKSKRQFIQETAAMLFREKGFAATSMRDLAKAVDLQASSLYNHFPSKQEILWEICRENATRFLDGMKAIQEQYQHPAKKVEALIRLHIQIATSDATSVTSFNDEWRHLTEPHLSNFRQMRKDYQDRFRAIIEEGIASGEFRPIHPMVALLTLLSSVRWIYDWYQTNKKLTTNDLETQLSELVLKGLFK